MRVITNLRHLKGGFKSPVVGIGIFDGVHTGHKKILKEITSRARRVKGTAIVITFNPHPAGLLDVIGAPPLLISLKHRLKLFEENGIDVACVLNFTREFSRLRAADFVKRILVKKMRAQCVVIGRDFKLGKDREGGVRLLERLGAQYGFRTVAVPLCKVGGRAVSSTRIRGLVASGELDKAQRLLGRPVSILGTIVRGSMRGRLLGYPTANINPHHEAIPPSGVYAIYAVLDRRRYRGMLNIGRRPTFGGNDEPTIEAHLFNFSKSIYGKDIEVFFIRCLRHEQRFKNREGLIVQIKVDEKRANMLL